MQPTLTPVRQTLHQSAQPLEYLWQAYAHLWQSLGWGEAQVRLWLRCLPESEAVRIVAEVRKRLPGFLVPKLVREVAGEKAKMPVFE
jgi:hypothetical protein